MEHQVTPEVLAAALRFAFCLLRLLLAQKKKEQPEQSARTYYRKKGISEEAQREIVSILMREKKRNAVNEKP